MMQRLKDVFGYFSYILIINTDNKEIRPITISIQLES